jgi:DNA repair exonuclease SbcCD nuclease subunit
MSEIKFIHISDLHLDSPFDFFPKEIADRRRQQLRDSFIKIVDYCLSSNDFNLFLISGDVFDNPSPFQDDLGLFQQQLNRLAKKEIFTFVIPGNHDPYQEGSFWDKISVFGKIFLKPEIELIRIESLNLTVGGIPYNPDMNSKNLVREQAEKAKPSSPRSILLLHGSWLDLGKNALQGHPFSTEDLERLHFNYIALGHYHRFTEILNTPLKKAYYTGSMSSLSFNKNELGERFFIQGKILQHGEILISPKPLESYFHQSIEIDCTECSLQLLRQKIEREADPQKYLKIRLTGRPSAQVLSFSNTIKERYARNFAYLKVEEDYLDPASVPQDNLYLKRFIQLIDAQIQESSPLQRELYQKAKITGIRAFLRNFDEEEKR